MIKTLDPHPNPAKTAEIMSKYRPIAPKPETPSNSTNEGSSSLSQKINQSPYLRNLWLSRPTRTRKRGRAPIAPPVSFKRQKPHVLGFCSPCHVTSPTKNLSLQSFAPALPQLSLPNNGVLGNTPSLVTLPLLPCSPSPHHPIVTELDFMKLGIEEVIMTDVPEEKDLLQKLQVSHISNVIAPQPVRPVGSCINVGCINEASSMPLVAHAPKRPEEVEEEVESEPLPAVISDSNNKVRMANSAYKEMVGQPECTWLESMVKSDGRLRCGSCTRISGEVTLHLRDSSIPISSNGFSCSVRIDWKTDHKISSVNAFCDVIRLSCQSRDYLFSWKFHTRATQASHLSFNV
ncbi:uncharacterized protein LOC133314535 [Gastrolobium bilobum]|uniref:uncharacterized protein LOC133314535 n=1 Tax=Gastrolobium bilobum TaxID=150636 RepID=UPI002AB21873|nr:uncharacterized protein LOC133314535 [Gastrolobium bilobum]